ncbi:MAG: 4-(cytidine 5'-diphospho)-2-C-methyl-D-erythritol kinase [Oscillospiraceae bacterium]|nr:4-(cytidine 5'-diphospho)-2-C-methyl-D-erythritol kinase [Oscillospiraceae bacterium]
MEIRVQAYGKLNLSLDILRRQLSGYHDMRMVMETVELCDDVQISIAEGDRVRLSTNLHYLPVDDSNIAAEAAETFFQELGIPRKQVTIHIHKRLPVSAGVAGGSANAAAVFRGLNQLMGTGLSAEEMRRLGLLLGSDVPYCISGGTALAEGRGEVLTPLCPLPLCHIVICKPRFSIRTADLFGRIDCTKIRHRPDTAGMVDALKSENLGQVAVRMYNVFEDVLDGKQKEVFAIKTALLDAGALGAMMSGTGPSAFGLFDDEQAARGAYERLRAVYPETYLTRNRRELLV